MFSLLLGLVSSCSDIKAPVDVGVVSGIRLPAVIDHNMVIQQGVKVPIWGWAEPGQLINVSGSWKSKSSTARADKDGKWQVEIDPPAKPGGPHEITINDKKISLQVTTPTLPSPQVGGFGRG